MPHALGAEFVRDHYATLAKHPGHWPSIAFSNHDVTRAVTRFGGGTPPPGLARLLLALLLSLRGTVLLYQGEELGLPQAHIRRDQLARSGRRSLLSLFRGRDGCRTPMPWDGGADNLGFTSGTPWLPHGRGPSPARRVRTGTDPGSPLHFTRRLHRRAEGQPALRWGEIEFVGRAVAASGLRAQLRERDACFACST